MLAATQPDHQQALFAPPPVPPTRPPAVTKPPDTPTKPVPPPEETITTEELLERIFQSMCSFRRFERELLLGASDEELGKIFGHAFCSGRGPIDLEFRPEGEPTLIVRDSTFKVEVMTMTAAQIAPYVRRLVEIPQPKSDDEKRTALDGQFDRMRAEERAGMLTYTRSLVGEKTPRKKKKGSDDPPSLSEQIVSLLFTTDCFSETTIRRNLIKIARLISRRTDQDTLRATKTALTIVDVANGRWRSTIGYWLDDNEPSLYQGPKAATKDDTSPP